MTDQTDPRRFRRGTAALILVLVLVIAAVTAIGLLTAGNATPGSTAKPSVGGGASTSTPITVPTTKAPIVTFTPTPAATASTPQPTKTATISSAAPIVKELTAKVSKLEAVQGQANGPGEIAGPAVRFTITITNSTGKPVDLSNTVVNAYFGKSSTPAIELQSPGGKPFPSSVANGKTATGVFVFNIAKADRGQVEVTVDTSVKNPVVAFKGSAPR